MSDTNGATPQEQSRILSLDAAKRSRGKSGDFITHGQAAQLIQDALASELPKIHEFYLSQIPPHVSRMILDALLEFGIIKPVNADIPPGEGDSIAPAPPSESPETRENTAVLDTAHDTITPDETNVILSPDPAAPITVRDAFPQSVVADDTTPAA